MDLINWPGLARNALWILGISIALAAWSYTSWRASVHDVRLRRALQRPRFQVPFSAGWTLFCVSLAWGATRWWERSLWIVLALAFLWQVLALSRQAAARGWDSPS